MTSMSQPSRAPAECQGERMSDAPSADEPELAYRPSESMTHADIAVGDDHEAVDDPPVFGDLVRGDLVHGDMVGEHSPAGDAPPPADAALDEDRTAGDGLQPG